MHRISAALVASAVIAIGAASLPLTAFPHHVEAGPVAAEVSSSDGMVGPATASRLPAQRSALAATSTPGPDVLPTPTGAPYPPAVRCRDGMDLIGMGETEAGMELLRQGVEEWDRSITDDLEVFVRCGEMLVELDRDDDRDPEAVLGTLEILKTMYEATENHERVARTLMEIGSYLRERKILDEAAIAYERAIAIWRIIGNDLGRRGTEGEAQALRSRGEILTDLGVFPEANRAFLDALRIYRDLGLRADEARVLNLIGRVNYEQGFLPEAMAAFGESRAIAPAPSGAAGVTAQDVLDVRAGANDGMARVHLRRRRMRQAVDTFRLALGYRAAREAPNPEAQAARNRGIAEAMRQVASAHMQWHAEPVAEECFMRALAIDLASSNGSAASDSLRGLCAVELSRTETERAERTCLAALSAAIDPESSLSAIGVPITETARSAKSAGEEVACADVEVPAAAMDRAQRYRSELEAMLPEDMEDRASRLSDRRVSSVSALRARVLLAEVYARQHRLPEALQTFDRAAEDAELEGHRSVQVDALLGEGDVLAHVGDVSLALARYQHVLRIAEASRDPGAEVDARIRLARVYSQMGLAELASQHGQRALSEAVTTGDRVREAEARVAVAALVVGRRWLTASDRPGLQRALASYAQHGDVAGQGLALSGIAQTYASEGQCGRADDAIARAEQLLEPGCSPQGDTAQPVAEANVCHRGALAAMLVTRARLRAMRPEGSQAAIGDLTRAAQLYGEEQDELGRGIALAEMGHVYDDGSVSGAKYAASRYDDALRSFERLYRGTFGYAAQRAFALSYLPLYDRAIVLYTLSGRPDLAFELSERGRARAFLDALDTRHVEVADRGASDLLDDLAAADAARAEALAALRLAQSDPNRSDVQAYAEAVRTAQAEYDDAHRALDEHDAMLAEVVSNRGRAASVNEVRDQLGDDEALISYWVVAEAPAADGPRGGDALGGTPAPAPVCLDGDPGESAAGDSRSDAAAPDSGMSEPPSVATEGAPAEVTGDDAASGELEAPEDGVPESAAHLLTPDDAPNAETQGTTPVADALSEDAGAEPGERSDGAAPTAKIGVEGATAGAACPNVEALAAAALAYAQPSPKPEPERPDGAAPHGLGSALEGARIVTDSHDASVVVFVITNEPREGSGQPAPAEEVAQPRASRVGAHVVTLDRDAVKALARGHTCLLRTGALDASHEVALALHALLVEPALDLIAEAGSGRRELLLIPHRELHEVSFAALASGDGALVDAFAIRYLPSASALGPIRSYATDDHDHEGTRPVFVAYEGGAPACPGFLSLDAAIERTLALAHRGDGWWRNAATDHLDAPLVVTGSQATEREVRALAARSSLLHVTAHASNRSQPLDSFLCLSGSITSTMTAETGEPDPNDGRMRVRELYELDLMSSDLVVLCACDTQGQDAHPGDDQVSLARAALHAGAPSVVSTLWTVAEGPAMELMEAFYAEIHDGYGKAEALRRAQVHVRRHGFGRTRADWAAFVLSGEGGRTRYSPALTSDEREALYALGLATSAAGLLCAVEPASCAGTAPRLGLPSAEETLDTVWPWLPLPEVWSTAIRSP